MTREKMMERIAALLAKAESTEFGPERDAFREKAEQLMEQYAIDEAELIRSEGRDPRAAVVTTWVYDVAPRDSEIRDALRVLFKACAENNRCRVAFTGIVGNVKMSEPIHGWSDVQFVKMLFNSLRIQMASELEPKYDHSLSLEDNVYEMRNAGLKWSRLEELCGLGPNGPAQRAYERACEERGEQPRKRIQSKTVKRNFANGFAGRVAQRLRENRERREADHGTSTALVPVSNAVNDVFKEHTTKSRGMVKRQGSRWDASAERRGKAAGDRADLGGPRVGQRPTLK